MPEAIKKTARAKKTATAPKSATAATPRPAKAKSESTAEAEPPHSRHAGEFETMIRRHVGNSAWLKAREPLLFALSDIAMLGGTSDSVRFRAIEKIEDLLERAEDEKRRQTFGSVSEGLEASIRRLERALRCNAGDRED